MSETGCDADGPATALTVPGKHGMSIFGQGSMRCYILSIAVRCVTDSDARR
jgi:hypothetical protein